VAEGPARLHSVSLREQVLVYLRQGIVSGQIEPGEIYSTAALAEQLGVSNSPVREAMLTLVHQGLTETVRNRGFRIVALSREDRDEIYQLRRMLEVPAVVAIARGGTAKDHEARLRELADGIVRSEAAKDVNEYLELDRAFHLELVGLGDNPRLTALVEELRDQTRRYATRALAERGGLAKAAKEHLALLDAVVAGDAERAAELMHRHLDNAEAEWGWASSEDPTATD
jgi:DNA-binding GntR family transcriptional regulator